MATPEWWHERLYPAASQSLLLTTLYERQSAYQHILIAENRHLGRVLVLDGVVQISEADACVYQEMMAHVPLMALDSPAERVLIVGGGDGAIAREVLRHPEVRHVAMVELDGEVVEACREWIPSLACDYNDPRLDLMVEDAAEYIKRAPERHFDVAIVDSPDPIGPAEVLFSSDFYGHIRRCLTPRGIAIFQSGVPFYQRDETAKIVQRLRALFTQVAICQAAVPTYIGGSMALTVASSAARPVQQSRANFSGRYYNAEVHTAAFALPTWWYEQLLA